MIYPVPFVLNTKDEAVRFSDIASRQNFGLSISTVDKVINAKSVLGLFPLIGKKVYLVADDNADPYAFFSFIKKMGI